MIHRRMWEEAIMSSWQIPSLELSGVSDGTYRCRQSGGPSSDRESNSRPSECKDEVRFPPRSSRGLHPSRMLRGVGW